ncbi:DTW domain-containing protein [Shewanella marinintestina]|uniref:DTW domain-containing protein n=1 Tax=Shewanella marinintestina TaxID=190305 RepID=UPI00200D11C3|nr:DTW domain-containing protein [Shewanella marinintestina]
MHVILLTHEREATRPTNTGNIALKFAGEHCERIIWSRVNPAPALLDKLALPGTALLFPNDATNGQEAIGGQANEVKALPETLIILDATWQEARKMLRQSPYLKTARTYSLTETAKSEFTLRRNQIEGGLCTLECIIELFKKANMDVPAQCLQAEFQQFCE